MTPSTLEASWSNPVVGLMFRREWAETMLAAEDDLEIQFLEVYPENYARRGGAQVRHLEELAERWPIISHGVHLSLGGRDPLSQTYLSELTGFLERYKIPWFSDHLGASVEADEILHEILPVTFTAGEAERIAHRADEAQSFAGRPFLIENATTYLVPPGSDLSEAEFTAQVFSQCDAGLLLDVNNLWVNSVNHGYSVDDYLNRIPLDRVAEIHLGGFQVDRQLGLLIDSHNTAPALPVWRLLETVLHRVGPKPILFEWESQYGSFAAIREQLRSITALWHRVAASYPA